jgi:hypothetical protein
VLVDDADLGCELVVVDVAGEEAADIACMAVSQFVLDPQRSLRKGENEKFCIPSPPMIKTAGFPELSSFAFPAACAVVSSWGA